MTDRTMPEAKAQENFCEKFKDLLFIFYNKGIPYKSCHRAVYC